jgi:general secretion pathway protein E
MRPLLLAEGLSREFLLHRRIVPKCFADDGALVVAVTPDALLDEVDELGILYDAPVAVEQASREEVEQLIERLASTSEKEIELSGAGAEDDDFTADARNLASQPPVVRYVNLMVREAYDAGASDIHLEATRSGLSVRFRLDGVLSSAQDPPAGLQHAVVSRVKLLAQLDIAERRRPQDGRIRVKMESRELDLRVSTVPTLHGESVVLRLLERGGRPVGLEELGLDELTLADMLRLTERPHGMILATGPTGSGKTTTLYAALGHRDGAAEKIITVEEPIEYQLPGITQVPVHRETGTTFATALRSILRQDPDVLMIGEMRDPETAELAVQAAMTGHMVFSTLHTNDAIGAIPRLLDLGVPSYLVAATVEGILAQRLVRRICADCSTTYQPPAESVATIAGRPVARPSLLRGAGCSSCRGTGFRGRVGVFELLTITDELRDAIARAATRAELKSLAVQQGMRLLKSDGWRKVQAGITTVEEVLRVCEA